MDEIFDHQILFSVVQIIVKAGAIYSVLGAPNCIVAPNNIQGPIEKCRQKLTYVALWLQPMQKGKDDTNQKLKERARCIEWTPSEPHFSSELVVI